MLRVNLSSQWQTFTVKGKNSICWQCLFCTSSSVNSSEKFSISRYTNSYLAVSGQFVNFLTSRANAFLNRKSLSTAHQPRGSHGKTN